MLNFEYGASFVKRVGQHRGSVDAGVTIDIVNILHEQYVIIIGTSTRSAATQSP